MVPSQREYIYIYIDVEIPAISSRTFFRIDFDFQEYIHICAFVSATTYIPEKGLGVEACIYFNLLVLRIVHVYVCVLNS